MAQQPSRRNQQQKTEAVSVEEQVTPETPVLEAVERQEEIQESPVAQEEERVEPTPSVAATETNNTAAFTRMELDQYAEAMAPGKYIEPTQGASYQLRFFRILERVVNRVSNEDFEPTMNMVLNWFHEQRDGVAQDSHLFRFAAEWSATADEFHAFNRLAVLFKLASEPKSRSVLIKDMNFEYYLEYGMTENGRERLLGFFGK